VTARNYDVGDMYAMTQPLFVIQKINPVKMLINISESQYSQIKKGMEVEITTEAYGDQVFKGIVDLIHPTINAMTHTFAVEVKFANKDLTLRPGMFARVTLTGQTVPNAILVPQRAVQQLLGKSFVMVVNSDSKSEARTVELGDKVGSYYIIKSGINADDLVVVEGLTNLQEGRDLAVTMVSAEEMGFSLEENNKQFDPDASTVKKQ